MTVEFDVRIRDNRLPRLQRIDWTPAFYRMASYMNREVGQMFDTQGASRGHTWQPLSPAYLQRKLAAGYSSKILHLSGVMRASFRVLEVSQTRMRFGSELARSRAHDRGKGVPERPLIRALDRDRAAFQRIGIQHVQDTVRRGGSA